MNRSVHNVRIERLWGDVTIQLGAQWAELFVSFELHHGLNINDHNHIWLLHYLFLNILNEQLQFFSQSWNQHKIQIRRGPNRSPADMFGFDMFVHGVRGAQLPPEEEELSEQELEVYGVDWEGLREERILQSRDRNNPSNEEASSWVGRVGPPDSLSGVELDAPEGPLSTYELQMFDQVMQHWTADGREVDLVELWKHGLATCRGMFGDRF